MGARTSVVAALLIAGSVVVVAPQRPAHAVTTPEVDVGSVAVQEGDAGKMSVQVPITLSTPPPGAVVVNYAVTDGTASRTDVPPKIGRVIFKANVVEKTVSVQVKSDTTVEGNETALVHITSVTGAAVSSDTGTLTVVDDDSDGTPATPELSVGSTAMYEGDAGARNELIPVTLSAPAVTPVTIDFATECDGGAGGVAKTYKTVTIPIGGRLKMVPVRVLPDRTPTGNDNVPDRVARRAGTTATSDDNGAIAVIDDDTPDPEGTRTPPPVGITRVSEASGGLDPTFPAAMRDPACGAGFPDQGGASVTEDGRYVVFYSNADNLVPDDTNGVADVFVRDTWSDVVDRVSVAADGTQADGPSYGGQITPDGRYVTFGSTADNLTPDDTDTFSDVFVVDLVLHTIEAVAPTNQPYIYTMGGGISDDGRYVVFETNEALAGDTDLLPLDRVDDAYVLDRSTGAITLQSKRRNGGPSWGQWPVISGDGNTVVWWSYDPGMGARQGSDTALGGDLFARNRTTGAIEKITVSSMGDAMQGFGVEPWSASLSADGTQIAFEADVCNFGAVCNPLDGHSLSQVYVRDRVAQTTTLESLNYTSRLIRTYGVDPSLSRNGRYLVFRDGDPGFDSGEERVVLRDLQTGTRVPADGPVTPKGDTYATSHTRSVTSDGRYVVFRTEADNLLGLNSAGQPNDGDRATDVFMTRMY